METNLKHVGVFSVFDNPGYSDRDLKKWLEADRPLEALPGVRKPLRVNNLLMASQKLLMANAVYPNVAKLVITRQTDPPVDTENTYTDIIYTAGSGEEIQRTPGNPYQIIWSVVSSDANGNWGSFVLADASNNIINRALAGVTKAANTGKIITFTGTVTS